MEEHQIAAIVDERINEAMDDRKTASVQMLAIRPFRAWDDREREVEVVGVAHTDDDLQFVALVDCDGECFPSLVDVVYRQPANPISSN